MLSANIGLKTPLVAKDSLYLREKGLPPTNSGSEKPLVAKDSLSLRERAGVRVIGLSETRRSERLIAMRQIHRLFFWVFLRRRGALT